jgi:hypothetical protein
VWLGWVRVSRTLLLSLSLPLELQELAVCACADSTRTSPTSTTMAVLAAVERTEAAAWPTTRSITSAMDTPCDKTLLFVRACPCPAVSAPVSAAAGRHRHVPWRHLRGCSGW